MSGSFVEISSKSFFKRSVSNENVGSIFLFTISVDKTSKLFFIKFLFLPILYDKSTASFILNFIFKSERFIDVS